MARLKVRELAEERGMNIMALSYAAKITYSQAWKIWNDKVSSLDFSTLDRLAQALNVRIGDLFAEEVESEEIQEREPVAA